MVDRTFSLQSQQQRPDNARLSTSNARAASAPMPDTLTTRYDFPAPIARTLLQPRITIVGVGGAGSNVLNHIGHIHDDAVRLIALNTDTQSLERTTADEHYCLGESITQGLGTGGDPITGERAADVCRHHIAGLLRGSDLIFIIAGMGGGTGTGAGPVVARVARELGALAIGIVTLPFAFEGKQRRHTAQNGLRQMAQSVDSLIVMPNDRLLKAVNQTCTINDAFMQADAMIRRGIAGIVDIITKPGLINVDLADIRAVLREAGPSLLAVGETSGPGRAQRAIEEAISGNWLNTDISGAQRVMLNITGSPDLTLAEVTEIANAILDRVDPDAHCVFGAVIDEDLRDTVRVSLIATGLPHFIGS